MESRSALDADHIPHLHVTRDEIAVLADARLQLLVLLVQSLHLLHTLLVLHRSQAANSLRLPSARNAAQRDGNPRSSRIFGCYDDSVSHVYGSPCRPEASADIPDYMVRR